jgi:hypothetical protein
MSTTTITIIASMLSTTYQRTKDSSDSFNHQLLIEEGLQTLQHPTTTTVAVTIIIIILPPVMEHSDNIDQLIITTTTTTTHISYH